MNITYVQFSGSNPSMGPHNTPSSNTLQMGSRPEALDSTSGRAAPPIKPEVDS